jgi:PKHD-type hydroxylase
MHHLPQVLTAEEVAASRDALADAIFEDGKATAGPAVKSSKINEQVAREQEDVSDLDSLVLSALSRHALFTSLVQPKRLLAPLYSRYRPGMRYGTHIDNPILGGAQPMRADVSITLFLSDPSSYDGGELTIESPGGARQIKLPAGDAIVYSTTAFHQVEPVTRGERLVAVTWAQSYVRDSELRQILHDLNAVVQSLLEQNPKAPQTQLLAKCHSNLLRRFAEL